MTSSSIIYYNGHEDVRTCILHTPSYLIIAACLRRSGLYEKKGSFLMIVNDLCTYRKIILDNEYIEVFD